MMQRYKIIISLFKTHQTNFKTLLHKCVLWLILREEIPSRSIAPKVFKKTYCLIIAHVLRI